MTNKSSTSVSDGAENIESNKETPDRKQREGSVENLENGSVERAEPNEHSVVEPCKFVISLDDPDEQCYDGSDDEDDERLAIAAYQHVRNPRGQCSISMY